MLASTPAAAKPLRKSRRSIRLHVSNARFDRFLLRTVQHCILYPARNSRFRAAAVVACWNLGSETGKEPFFTRERSMNQCQSAARASVLMFWSAILCCNGNAVDSSPRQQSADEALVIVH